MSKRKLPIAIFSALVLAFVGALIATLSRPPAANVNVSFAGYTMAPSPFSSRFVPTNVSFSVSNASAAKVRLTFRDYQLNDNNNVMFVSPSGLGILCELKPGQSTNLVFPMIPLFFRAGSLRPTYRWRVEFSSRYDWLAKLNRQPKWLQNMVTIAIPRSWMAELHRGNIVSNWITNREETPDFPRLIKVSPLNSTNHQLSP